MPLTHTHSGYLGVELQPEWLDFPGVEDGIRGMQFIDLVVEAGFNDEVKWMKWPE